MYLCEEPGVRPVSTKPIVGSCQKFDFAVVVYTGVVWLLSRKTL